MSYEFFYPGTPYSLDPTTNDLSTGYQMKAYGIGVATDPRTANQLGELATKLNVGTKTMEISTVSPDIIESIPNQHLKEINRLSKLTGVSTTLHGPMVEASGYTKEGWDESGRKQAETQMWSAVERSHELNPEGNMNVTFHSSAMLPQGVEMTKEKGVESAQSFIVADPRTGQIQQIKKLEKYFPEERMDKEFKEQFMQKHHLSPEEIEKIESGKIFYPEWEIEKTNKQQWTKSLNDVNFYASRGIESVDFAFSERKKIINGVKEENPESENYLLKAFKQENPDEIPDELSELRARVKPIFRQLNQGDIFLRDSYNNLRELFNRAYKDASGEDKNLLDGYKKEMEGFVKTGFERDPEKLKEFADKIEEGISVLRKINHPQLFQPLNDFLIDKSSETFSNVALKSYDKFGNSAPIISIENPPYGGALSKAEELKQLIVKSREKFVEKAVQQGMSKSEASDAAKKLIGATWDVGHINMIRKYGYGKEDLIKQAEIIAPYAKHVHLSDNFGLEHTELPMGMGNVPIKEIMEKLGQEGFEGKKIIEAGNWFQHFKTSPFTQTLEAFGSPLYSMKAPYWSQIANTYGNYFQFPSAYMPEQHFSLYGGGMSGLPAELGGQMPGKQSRVSGTPTD